jgi:hypothetical protein
LRAYFRWNLRCTSTNSRRRVFDPGSAALSRLVRTVLPLRYNPFQPLLLDRCEHGLCRHFYSLRKLDAVIFRNGLQQSPAFAERHTGKIAFVVASERTREDSSLRFCNRLNTGRPESSSTTSSPSRTVSGGRTSNDSVINGIFFSRGFPFQEYSVAVSSDRTAMVR